MPIQIILSDDAAKSEKMKAVFDIFYNDAQQKKRPTPIPRSHD